ncbi:cytochrome c-type biogenesis protein [Histidinibacterium aquaticum]|uniref:Cytochrome c-type biogenesis protein n=1 Tax=Histidinibacterium aquaticum TaxID=2613962 RepID=A0A5J5GNJ3_9RHOB|nr:cytochrome c-type biogenesis protein [Histidinibacterium aquaticum]KAA9009012.1 cytochrome c-type biogenesis protein CcmH [Histidinibacterium aquaticum]
MKRLLLILCLLAAPLWAVQPDEMLDDPALEARAREISQGLRCPVCQNESIDESNAPVSRDLRLLVRERLVEGDSDAEVVDYIVERYGEFVLLSPPREGANLVLWWSAPVLFILGLGIAWAAIRGRGRAAPPEGLSDEEEARLRELTGD